MASDDQRSDRGVRGSSSVSGKAAEAAAGANGAVSATPAEESAAGIAGDHIRSRGASPVRQPGSVDRNCGSDLVEVRRVIGRAQWSLGLSGGVAIALWWGARSSKGRRGVSGQVENCGNCAFGVAEYMHNSSRINCQRRAPIVFHGVIGSTSRQIGRGPEYQTEQVMGAVTAWPTVSQYNFCGDFELKDAQ